MYRALGERQQDVRDELLKEAKVTLSGQTVELLASAGHLTFCEAVGILEEESWTADRVRRRTEGLAERMVRVVWPWLTDGGG
jgi:hypothetical protein